MAFSWPKLSDVVPRGLLENFNVAITRSIAQSNITAARYAHASRYSNILMLDVLRKDSANLENFTGLARHGLRFVFDTINSDW